MVLYEKAHPFFRTQLSNKERKILNKLEKSEVSEKSCKGKLKAKTKQKTKGQSDESSLADDFGSIAI
jgi:hypothetical protein